MCSDFGGIEFVDHINSIWLNSFVYWFDFDVIQWINAFSFNQYCLKGLILKSQQASKLYQVHSTIPTHYNYINCIIPMFHMYVYVQRNPKGDEGERPVCTQGRHIIYNHTKCLHLSVYMHISALVLKYIQCMYKNILWSN